MTRPGDELLSAHFDDELAPKERAAVEDWLRDSPAARDELAEIARLSELLQELPSEPAPPGLRQSVLDQVQTKAAPPPGVSRSRWILALSGLALSALAVLTVSRWATEEPQSVAVRETEWESADTTSDTASGRAMAPEFTDGAPARPDVTEIIEARPNAARFARRADGGFGKESAEADEALGMRQRQAASEPPPADGIVLGSRTVQLKRMPHVGEILRLTGGDADRVAVIEVTVVDKQEALAGLQLLLAANAIPPRLARDRQVDRKLETNPEGVAPLAVREGELWAVYVQATDEMLATSLAAMQRRNLLFREVRINDAVPLDAVPLTDASAASIASPAPRKKTLHLKEEKPAPPGERNAADGPAVAERPGFPSSRRESAAAFQIALRGQPPRAMGRTAPKSAALRPGPSSAEPAADGDSNGPAGALPRAEAEPSEAPRLLAGPTVTNGVKIDPAPAPREPRLLRVLFVLRTEDTAAKPAQR